MQKFSLWFSIFALFISCNVFLITLSRDYQWAGDAVYSLSLWSGDTSQGMSLRFYGLVPIGYCYSPGASVEEEKRCIIGNSRYERFHRPSEQSEG